MDTLSTSLTTFQLPKPHTTNPSNHHNYHLKPTPLSHHHPSTVKPPPSIQKDTNFPPLYPKAPTFTTSSSSPFIFKPPRASSTHKRAASGYAAALLDVSQCNGVVLEVERDVKRLLRLLKHGQVKDFLKDDTLDEKVKSHAVKELVVKGKFEGHLVGLVKVIVDKGKRVSLVKEALEEFERIFFMLIAPPVTPAGT